MDIYISTQEGFVYQARTSRFLLGSAISKCCVPREELHISVLLNSGRSNFIFFCFLLRILSHFYYAPQCVTSPSKRGCSVRVS